MPARKQADTYLKQLDELPPFKCWMLARKGGGKPITQIEIARTTKWTLAKVEKMCGLKTWAEVTVEDADAFRLACGVSRSSERRHRYYLKRTLDLRVTASGLSHFRKHPAVASQKLIRLAVGGSPARTDASPCPAPTAGKGRAR